MGCGRVPNCAQQSGSVEAIFGRPTFSPRTLVFSDGIMLSNPSGRDCKWVMVAPEEIERVDIIYGPYSALYSGNAIGGVVLMTTKLPDEREISANTSYFYQNYREYKSDDDLGAYTTHVSYGDKLGKFHILGLYDRLESEAYPVSFVTKLKKDGVAAATGNSVSGWDYDSDRDKQGRYILGSYGSSKVATDLFKLRVAYDINSFTQAEMNLGYLTGDRETDKSETYLRDSAGNKIYSGTVNIDGLSYTIPASQFYYQELTHEEYINAFSFKSEPQDGVKTWATASFYNIPKELTQQSTTAPPTSKHGGAGTVTEAETGWYNFDFKASYRPSGFPALSDHTFTGGYRYDLYFTDSEKWNASDWKRDIRTTLEEGADGKTATHAVFFQDEWEFVDKWMLYLGGRYEWWRGFDGSKSKGVGGSIVKTDLGEREEDYFSPKIAVTYRFDENWNFRVSLANVFRFPSVGELYYGKMNPDGSVVATNPDLKTEEVFAKDFTIMRNLGTDGKVRLSFFENSEKDTIFSQTNIYTMVTNYQNIDEVRKRGVELSAEKRSFLIDGLGVMGSITYTDAEILENTNRPTSEGKTYPRCPEWTANTVISYSPVTDLTFIAGGRYASKPWETLDNTDTEGGYGGCDSYLVFDTKIIYAFLKNWKASVGIDNITDELYHMSHPYPRRTVSAMLEAKF
ncbi:MAG: TonB-dependent receptor [Pseudomonadota bacterium]